MAALISVVIPIRNRAGARLDNCLRSLRWQDTRFELEIVVADFGSDPAQASALVDLAASHGAIVVREQTNALWNRSRALNLGIQASSGQYVLCTDADMIFTPDFVQSAVDTLQQSEDRALVLCRCHDLPESVAEQPRTRDEIPALRSAARVRQTSGTGACQAATRAFFFAVRGYDEAFEYWGAEDNDMVDRATRYGLQPTWLGEQPAMFHQWHATMKNDRPFKRKLNHWRYKLTRWQVVKNRKRWGNLGPVAAD